jgi:hypothetical protein
MDPSRTVTIEDFIAARDRIFDLSTAKPYTSTLDDETISPSHFSLPRYGRRVGLHITCLLGKLPSGS